MPPRKRARVSQAASPTPTSQPKTPTPAHESPSKSEENVLNDPWTDEEEIGLFKGLMQWKPTGIHKHFRLMALHQYLLTNNYIHPRNPHTKPAGIWRKLQNLYDLEALDEREDARQLSDLSLEDDNSSAEDETDVYSVAENKIHREDFSLPDEEYAMMKWRQRFPADKSQSPPALPELNLAKEPPITFTPSFSVEPSETVGKKRGAAAGRRGKAAAAATGTRRSKRQAEEEQEEEEDEEEDEEESSGDEEAEESEASSAPARPARGGRGRGRGVGRGRGRGRGRGK